MGGMTTHKGGVTWLVEKSSNSCKGQTDSSSCKKHELKPGDVRQRMPRATLCLTR